MRAWRARRTRGPPAPPRGCPPSSHSSSIRWTAGSSPPDPGGRTRGRDPSRHPVAEDRRDPAERLEEQRALLGVLRDQFDVRAYLPRHPAEVLNQIAVLDHRQGPAVFRAGRQLSVLRHGLLSLPVAVRTPQLEPGFPQPFGDEECLDRPELQRMTDVVLAVRREASVLLTDFLHQPLNQGLFSHQVETAQNLPRLLDELPEAILVRVARVEKGRHDSFLHFVVEIIPRRELFLRVTRASDDGPLDVRLVQEGFRHQISNFLVTLVAGDVVAPFEG